MLSKQGPLKAPGMGGGGGGGFSWRLVLSRSQSQSEQTAVFLALGAKVWRWRRSDFSARTPAGYVTWNLTHSGLNAAKWCWWWHKHRRHFIHIIRTTTLGLILTLQLKHSSNWWTWTTSTWTLIPPGLLFVIQPLIHNLESGSLVRLSTIILLTNQSAACWD